MADIQGNLYFCNRCERDRDGITEAFIGDPYYRGRYPKPSGWVCDLCEQPSDSGMVVSYRD